MKINGNTVIMTAADVRRCAALYSTKTMKRVKRVAFSFDTAGELLQIDAFGSPIDANTASALEDSARETLIYHRTR